VCGWCVYVCICITAYQVIHVQPEDGHYQVPKHVVVLYVIIIIYIHHIVLLDSKFTPL